MDRTTLVDPAVRAALEDHVKIKFQAEYPDEPPARDLMRRIGAIGLPAYAIFRPEDRGLARSHAATPGANSLTLEPARPPRAPSQEFQAPLTLPAWQLADRRAACDAHGPCS
jgi:hypothetical protein